MIITKIMIDSVKETIKKNNTICDVIKHILASIVKEAKENKRVSVRKMKDLLTIQTEFITAFDEHIASDKLSKEQIEERAEVLKILQEMTKSLFDDAFIALDKRLSEFKNESQDKRKDELNELTKSELIDLVTILEKEKEQK